VLHHPPAFRTAVALAASLLLAACATRPTEYRAPAPPDQAERAAHHLAVFDRAWSLVNDKYFDATFHGVDWQALRVRYRPEADAARDEDDLYRILNRMIAELRDRHVYAISPRQAHEGRQHHALSFGFRERVLDSGRTVTQLSPGGPAEAAGVRVGWRILSPEASELDSVRSSDQVLSFSFLDEHDQPRTVSLSPSLLPFDQLRTDAHLVNEDVLYLRFDHFNQSSASWLSRELKSHLAVPAVIVDLRENVGGDDDALRLAVREFFAEGRNLGRTVDRTGAFHRLDTLSFFSARYPGKVIVLIGETTASSAEIFARTLQFYQRATLVGRPTAGSVVEAFRHRLPEGGYLKISERDFIDPADQRLEGRGVTPDLAAPLPTLAELRTGHDPDLSTALTALGWH